VGFGWMIPVPMMTLTLLVVRTTVPSQTARTGGTLRWATRPPGFCPAGPCALAGPMTCCSQALDGYRRGIATAARAWVDPATWGWAVDCPSQNALDGYRRGIATVALR
jgi:hypothetical protein